MINGFDEPPIYAGGEQILMRPRTLEALKKVSDHELTEWLTPNGPGGDAGKFRALAFMELAERHRDADPGELWEAAADVAVNFEAPPAMDPTEPPPS